MTSEKINRQYGLWQSPITATNLARGLNFTDLAWDHDGTLIWREGRSDQSVLVVQPPDGQAPRDLNSDYNVRAGVGYGGGDFSVAHGFVYFVEAKSGRIYRQPTHQGLAEPITPAFGAAAAPTVSPDGKYLLYVHTYERRDSICLVDTAGENWPVRLVSGADFYMQPCWHPAGDKIAWIAWNHPQMPWDGTELQVAELHFSEGLPTLGAVHTAIGDPATSVFQPQFSPDGRHLAYVADPDGWWQLYLRDLETDQDTVYTGGNAEHAFPAWVQGVRSYNFSADGKSIYFLRNQDGFIGLWHLDIASKMKTRVRIGSEYTWLQQIAVAPHADQVAVLASGGRIPNRVLVYTPQNGPQILRRSLSEALPDSYYALPQPVDWPGMDGETVYGLYYAPRNPAYAGAGLPPLMVLIHGGPTGQRGASFDGQAQYFSSRGWGVLQVNYRGSAGYGRAYRDQLKGNWGIYDVQDAVSGAKYLAADGAIDPKKCVIMGGSAGGFTVLKALEDYPGFFKAGVCLYGVANQFTLVADTHKFEAHYSDSLLGALPEAAEIYHQRSPLFFADQIQDPLAIFQGEDDKVVPQSQSDGIVAALRRTGAPHVYHLYPGEGHGFRKTETIEHFYQAVESFLHQYVIYT